MEIGTPSHIIDQPTDPPTPADIVVLNRISAERPSVPTVTEVTVGAAGDGSRVSVSAAVSHLLDPVS